MKSLSHLGNYIDITNEEIDILTYLKSILTDSKRIWVKIYIDNFDVPMCSYNCTNSRFSGYIYIYIFDLLGRIINLNQMDVYRYDGLIFIPDSNGPETSRM